MASRFPGEDFDHPYHSFEFLGKSGLRLLHLRTGEGDDFQSCKKQLTSTYNVLRPKGCTIVCNIISWPFLKADVWGLDAELVTDLPFILAIHCVYHRSVMDSILGSSKAFWENLLRHGRLCVGSTGYTGALYSSSFMFAYNRTPMMIYLPHPTNINTAAEQSLC